MSTKLKFPSNKELVEVAVTLLDRMASNEDAKMFFFDPRDSSLTIEATDDELLGLLQGAA